MSKQSSYKNPSSCSYQKANNDDKKLAGYDDILFGICSCFKEGPENCTFDIHNCICGNSTTCRSDCHKCSCRNDPASCRHNPTWFRNIFDEYHHNAQLNLYKEVSTEVRKDGVTTSNNVANLIAAYVV